MGCLSSKEAAAPPNKVESTSPPAEKRAVPAEPGPEGKDEPKTTKATNEASRAGPSSPVKGPSGAAPGTEAGPEQTGATSAPGAVTLLSLQALTRLLSAGRNACECRVHRLLRNEHGGTFSTFLVCFVTDSTPVPERRMPRSSAMSCKGGRMAATQPCRPPWLKWRRHEQKHSQPRRGCVFPAQSHAHSPSRRH